MVALVVIGLLLATRQQRSYFSEIPDSATGLSEGMGEYLMEPIPTGLDVLEIEGHPDMHVVDRGTGEEMIRSGDIALSPGFGVGEGTFGFGRFASSFMA